MYSIKGLFRSICMLLLYISLSACLSWQDQVYKMSPTEDTAILYLDIPANTQIGVFKDKQCSKFKQGSNLAQAIKNSPTIPIRTIVNKLRTSASKNDYKPYHNSIKKIKIPVGNNLVFTLLHEEFGTSRDGSAGIFRCALSFSFFVIKNKEYLLEYKAIDSSNQCFTAVIDIEKSRLQHKLKKPAGYKRNNKDCSY